MGEQDDVLHHVCVWSCAVIARAQAVLPRSCIGRVPFATLQRSCVAHARDVLPLSSLYALTVQCVE